MFKIENTFKDHKLERVMVNGKRHYLTPDGNKYPSVTTVLSSLNKEAIQEWRNKVGHEEAQKITTQASRRGTAVHLLCEKYVANDPNWAQGAMPVNIETFKSIKKYLDEWCDVVYASELQLYSNELKTAGTCDLIARIHGIRTVGDFKTSRKRKEKEWITNYFYQCAAYAIMLQEREGVWCPQICLMIATDNDGLQVFLEHTANYVNDVKQFFKDHHDQLLTV
jgi:hypothetical protein